MIRGWAPLLLASLLLAVSGCVAAAIPIAAGAAAIKVGTDRARSGEPKATAEASAASDMKVTLLATTTLPPPDAPIVGASSAIAPFRDYALAQLKAEPAAGKRPSALLTQASELRSERANCGSAPLAVFIDLDPGRGTFDPLAPGTPDPALPAALLEIREQGGSVVWFSRLSDGFEAAARAALVSSGLDPLGSDRVELLRDLGERKQSRRDEAAKSACPVAMLGDERADFDELYLYLKQPEAALALDAMIGRGWFIASPFAQVPEPTQEPVQ